MMKRFFIAFVWVYATLIVAQAQSQMANEMVHPLVIITSEQ